MIEYLYNIDFKILFFINNTLSNSFFDFIMPLFDNVKNWIPYYFNIMDFIIIF